MNIETLAVEYIRTGRLAADAILHEKALKERLAEDVLSCLEKLRDRICLPGDAMDVVEPIQKAIEEERDAAQSQLDQIKEINRARENAGSRIVQLRVKKEVCALFEAATLDFLDALAAEKLQHALSQTM